MIIETKGDTITLNGVIDKNIWPALQAAVAVLLKDHPAGIIIDCGSITRITPAGIGTFASAFRYITQKNAGIIFVSASEEVISLARATEGVRSKMPVAADVEEARHSLSLRETVIRKLGGKNNIVVPLTDGWQTALAYAVRLRKGKEYRYHAAALIRLPLSLSIYHPMPAEEQKAEKDLDKAEDMVEGFGETVCRRYTLRVRNAGDIFHRFPDERTRFLLPDAALGADRQSRGPALMDLLRSREHTVELFSVKGASDPDKIKRVMTVYDPGLRQILADCEQLARVADEPRVEVTVVFAEQVPRSMDIAAAAPPEAFGRAQKELRSMCARLKHVEAGLTFLPVRSYASDVAALAEKEQTELFVIPLETSLPVHSQKLQLAMSLYYSEICSLFIPRV